MTKLKITAALISSAVLLLCAFFCLSACAANGSDNESTMTGPQSAPDSKTSFDGDGNDPTEDDDFMIKYDFSDSFSDLRADRWTPVSGSWSAESGAYAGSGLTFAKDTDFSDFRATFTIDGKGGLVLRALDSDNYYLAEFDTQSCMFAVYKVISGSVTELGRSERLECVVPFEVNVSANGDTIRMYGSCVELTVQDGSFTSGKIGLYAQSETAFDNLHVTRVSG